MQTILRNLLLIIPVLLLTTSFIKTNSSASAVSSSEINLSWAASTDSVGVTGYKIYRAGVQAGTSPTSSYSDTGLSPLSSYTYRVSAYDAAGNNSSQSSSTSATTQASSVGDAPTVTYNVAIESNAGMDGGIAWQSVFLLNDGRIASWGTGNHVPDQTNAMRIIDPVTTPGTVTSYDLFPWTQDINPPNMVTGHNRYVTNYDNHAQIYIPSENIGVWVNHGVFDFNLRTWTYGDRPPLTQTWNDFLYDPLNSYFMYNPSIAWCNSLDKGVLYGGGGGGYGRAFDDLVIIERNPSGSQPWKMTTTNMASQGVAALQNARNTVVCIGNYLYVAGKKQDGTGNAFYKIDVTTKTRLATLNPYPAVTGESQPQLVYDSKRGHMVLIGLKVLDYDIAYDSWSDVTPTNWPGYAYPNGVYHPGLDVIFFRGIPVPLGWRPEDFQWHKMSFGTAATDTQSPTIPSNLSATAISSSRINLSWSASTDNMGVTSYRLERCQGASCTAFSQIATPTATSYSDSGLSANTIYGYQVRAGDAAGNLSGYSSAVNATTQSAPTGNNWRLISVNPNATPFLGPPDAGYGGAKHSWWVWNPIMRRIYNWGGDYGVGASNFGQPDAGANFTTNDPSGGRTYSRIGSLENDQYSFDPYAPNPISWRLEHRYVPRLINGQREARPARPDQASLVWDSARNKFWGIYTVLRTEFLYRLPNGDPDMWANGDMTPPPLEEPNGTWSFAPSPDGDVGTWTLETSARVAFRYGSTFYSGNVLVSGDGGERIGQWEYDPATDRIVGVGRFRIFIFNPQTKTYEHRSFSPNGYTYMETSASYIAVNGDWMYFVGITSQSGVRKSQLIRVNIPNILGLANGASIPDNSSYWEAIQLPWSLSPGNIWENNGDAWANWQEDAGVEAVGGKIVIINSIGGIIEDGVTKLTIWDPITRTFTSGATPPSNFAANSWEALPDTGEVIMGNNTSALGYSGTKIWAYKVSSESSDTTPPAAPTTVRVN